MQLTRIAQTLLLTVVASHASAATMDSARTRIAEQAQKLEPELLDTAAIFTLIQNLATLKNAPLNWSPNSCKPWAWK